MAIMKANKMKNDDSRNQYSFPDLSQKLSNVVNVYGRQIIIYYGGVTKIWRPTPKQCNPGGKSPWPQLVEIDTNYSCNNHENISGKHIFEIEFDQEFPMHRAIVSTHYRPRGQFKTFENVFSLSGFSSKLSNVSNRCLRPDCHWCGPSYGCVRHYCWSFEDHPFEFMAVTPDENEINCHVMVLTGQSSQSFAFCEFELEKFDGHKDKMKWNLRDYTVKDPYNPGRNMEFCHGFGFKGKFYMLSLQGSLVVIEDTSSGFEVTGVSKGRAIPCNISRQFREFFVELNGEMLLVFLLSRKSINVVDDVEVFRLDVEGLLWLKVESIGDGALFVRETCCVGINAGKIIGCRKNCIYFTNRGQVNEDLWFVYDVKIGRIFPVSIGTGDMNQD